MKHKIKKNIVPFEVLNARDKDIMSGYSDEYIIFYWCEFSSK